MKATLTRRLLSLALLAAPALPAFAQEEVVESKVYAYAEQMPQLPGKPGTSAIVAAIQQNLRLPASVRRDHVGERVFVGFTVDAKGEVKDVVIKKGLTADLDEAVTKAVLKLPRFVPGQQNGRAVQVAYVALPITIRDPELPTQPAGTAGRGNQSHAAAYEPAGSYQGRSGTYATDEPMVPPAAEPAPVVSDSTRKVYTYVEQMPAMPGGGGMAAILAAIQQRLVLPADVQEGRVYISFTAGPHGTVYDEKIVRGLSASTNEAVLRAVRQLPRFVPGKQNGVAVAVSFTVPLTIRSPNHVYEAREAATRPRFPAPGLTDYLRRNLRVPTIVATEKLRGRVGITYVLGASGRVDSARVTRHLCASCDAEALRLVRAFPAWTPARDAAGQPVASRQHLEVPVPLPTLALPYVATDKPLPYAQEQPTLLDGTTGPELTKVLEKSLVYPAAIRQENISGPVSIEFVVDANGLVRNAHVTHTLCVSCDQAVLAALTRLGFFTPGRQQSQPVAVQMQLTVQFDPAAGSK